MNKILAVLLLAFSFSQEISTKEITISVDNNTGSIDISNYVSLASGYYDVQAIFVDNFNTNIGPFDAIEFSTTIPNFFSNFNVGFDCFDEYQTDCGGAIYDPNVTISYDYPTILANGFQWLEDDNPGLSISFDLVLRISGVFDESRSL